MVKNLPAMQETWVRSLGQEDRLEKEMATPIPIFTPGEFHGQRRLVGYSPWDCKELDTTEQLNILGPRLGGEYECMSVSVCACVKELDRECLLCNS